MRWTEALAEFYGKFTKDLEIAKRSMRDVKRQEIITDEKCESCNSPMAIKFGRYGQFLACTNYPDCRRRATYQRFPTRRAKKLTPKPPKEIATMRQADGDEARALRPVPRLHRLSRMQDHEEDSKGRASSRPDVVLEESCPNCGKHLVIKQGGSATLRPVELSRMQVHQAGDNRRHLPRGRRRDRSQARKGKKGLLRRLDYPNCKFALWDKPVAQPCPECGARFMVEKIKKGREP